MLPIFTLSAIPLSVLNRALDLFNVEREKTPADALAALESAEGRKDAPGPYMPLAQAVAEYMSLTGPWSEENGEYAGQSGYRIDVADASPNLRNRGAWNPPRL